MAAEWSRPPGSQVRRRAAEDRAGARRAAAEHAARCARGAGYGAKPAHAQRGHRSPAKRSKERCVLAFAKLVTRPCSQRMAHPSKYVGGHIVAHAAGSPTLSSARPTQRARISFFSIDHEEGAAPTSVPTVLTFAWAPIFLWSFFRDHTRDGLAFCAGPGGCASSLVCATPLSSDVSSPGVP
jgi:hypothetical protein